MQFNCITLSQQNTDKLLLRIILYDLLLGESAIKRSDLEGNVNWDLEVLAMKCTLHKGFAMTLDYHSSENRREMSAKGVPLQGGFIVLSTENKLDYDDFVNFLNLCFGIVYRVEYRLVDPWTVYCLLCGGLGTMHFLLFPINN